MSGFINGLCGMELRSPHLSSEHFKHCAIPLPPAPVLYLIFQELARYCCFPGERQRNRSNLYSSMLSTEPYSL